MSFPLPSSNQSAFDNAAAHTPSTYNAHRYVHSNSFGWGGNTLNSNVRPSLFPSRLRLFIQTRPRFQLPCDCCVCHSAACCGHVTHSQAYFTQDRSIDAFTSANPASLVIFSAGNNGARGFGTVTKSCKNCLMTGATQQSDALFRSMEPFIDPGWFCPVLGIAFSCCSNRLSCVTQQCCSVVDAANMSLACCGQQTKCSAGGQCSVESGNIRSAFNVASFSSLGPTADGRFKPDLVVPGEDTLSAATPTQNNISVPFVQTTADHCVIPNKTVTRSPENLRDSALRTASGTSMAAPLLAAAAEKIRQYFVQG